jgi:hypothetical protein
MRDNKYTAGHYEDPGIDGRIKIKGSKRNRVDRIRLAQGKGLWWDLVNKKFP